MWEIGRWLRTARPSIDGGAYDHSSLDDYLGATALLACVPTALHRAAHVGPVVGGARPHARDPGRVRDPLLRQSRDAGASASSLENRHGWLAHLRAGLRGYLRFVDVNLPVRGLRRDDEGVLVRTDDDVVRRFDRAVVATHADEALALLEDPSDDERAILGAFGYTQNDAVLHTDSSLLPRCRAAHASWNYRVDGAERPTVTYYLNRLQQLETETDYMVTLNQPVADEHVLRRFSYTHPRFTVDAIRAQARLAELSGTRHTEFAGAYFGNGFHEDGLAAGVRAAAALGARW